MRCANFTYGRGLTYPEFVDNLIVFSETCCGKSGNELEYFNYEKKEEQIQMYYPVFLDLEQRLCDVFWRFY